MENFVCAIFTGAGRCSIISLVSRVEWVVSRVNCLKNRRNFKLSTLITLKIHRSSHRAEALRFFFFVAGGWKWLHLMRNVVVDTTKEMKLFRHFYSACFLSLFVVSLDLLFSQESTFVKLFSPRRTFQFRPTNENRPNCLRVVDCVASKNSDNKLIPSSIVSWVTPSTRTSKVSSSCWPQRRRGVNDRNQLRPLRLSFIWILSAVLEWRGKKINADYGVENVSQSASLLSPSIRFPLNEHFISFNFLLLNFDWRSPEAKTSAKKLKHSFEKWTKIKNKFKFIKSNCYFFEGDNWPDATPSIGNSFECF